VTTSLHDRALDLGHRFAGRVASTLAHGTPVLGPLPPAPPGPLGNVVLGNMAEGWSRPLELFSRCMTDHGPIARLRFGASFYYLVNDPDLVRHVFVENARNYKKSRNYRGIKIVLGDGLFTSEGEHWKRQRKLAQPGFHRERLAGFARTMSEATRAAIARLSALAGEPIQLNEEVSRLALGVVCQTLFSADVGAEADAIGRAVSFANEFGESAYFLPTWVPTRKNRELKRALAVFDELVARLVRERRAGAAKDDLLSMLMAATDADTGERMSEQELRDEALTLIIGGHETTATVLAWTFYLLSLHPDVARRLRAHVVSVLGDRDPTAEDVPKLAYTAQVVQEAMRLYPPAWVIEREAIAADRLAGYEIPPGATLAVCPYALHRHPAHWPNPEGFDPDHFATEAARDRSRYVYLPFGVGPRVCIGNAFAMMETVIIVSMMARALRFDLSPSERVEPEPVMTLRPKGGLRMVVRPA